MYCHLACCGMRVMMLALALLLAGCSGPSSDDVDGGPAPAGDGHGEHGGDAPSAGNATSPFLGSVDCDMPDRAVYTTGGVRNEYFGTGSRCELGSLDLPEPTRSLRFEFTYTVRAAEGEFGIRLYAPDQCTQTSSGDECNIAEAFGLSPVTLDVDAATLDGYDISELDAYAVGYGADTTLDLEISFFSSGAPVDEPA